MKSLAILAAVTLAAAPLVAQDTTHARHPATRPGSAMGRRGMQRGGDDQMMAMMREMMAPMMRVMAYTPDHLIDHKDSLNLTADQVTKLTAIRDSAKAAHDAAGNDFKMHMNELSQVFATASPDTATLRAHFDAAQTAMGKAHWAMLSAAARSRALLTDAQRTKIDAWVSAMSQREHM